MISVMVRIIITGFEDFGSGFWFLFRFTVLKNLTNFRFFLQKEKKFFFYKKKLKNGPKWRKKRGKRPKTIIRTVIFSVQVRVFSDYPFSVFSVCSFPVNKSPKIPVFSVLIRLWFCSGSGSRISGKN